MRIAMMTNNYKPFVGGVPISIERLADKPYQYNDYEYFSSQKGIGNFAGNRFI